jgi:hypothetical protein
MVAPLAGLDAHDFGVAHFSLIFASVHRLKAAVASACVYPLPLPNWGILGVSLEFPIGWEGNNLLDKSR